MHIFVLCVCRDGKPPNFAMKAAMGITAGAVGSFIGTPAEISLIRMTADGRYVYYSITCVWLCVLLCFAADKS